MYPATVTRFFFYFIWILFLIPQVIESVNPIEHQVNQQSGLKRNGRDEKHKLSWRMMQSAKSKMAETKENLGAKAKKILLTDEESGKLRGEQPQQVVAAVDDPPPINTRIAADNSWEVSSEEARRALPVKDGGDDDDDDKDDDDDDSDEETRRAAAEPDESVDDETRRQAAPTEPDDEREKAKMKFWSKIMESAIQRAAELKNVNGELKDKVETRIATGTSDENEDEKSDDETSSSSAPDADTRRAAHSGESDEDTRRSQDTTDESDEETRRAADNSEEEDDAVEEARRRAGAVGGDSGATEDETEDEEEAWKVTTKLEGTSDGSSRRYQKNVNVNQNVNTNINSNAQIDPMAYQRDEEYRPLHRPDAKLRQNIPDDIHEKLHACDVFRDNIVIMMGYLLRLPDGQLSSHEYASLELLYNALKSKNVYMYNTLPSLRSLRDKSISEQFVIALKGIGQNLPKYMKSATEFWINRIEKGRINLDSIFAQNPKIQMLTGIPAAAFSVSRRGAIDEISAYNHGSRLTEELMGPIYVSIFHLLDESHRNLTQQLFGAVIRDLPNAGSDPVFEEYVRYISDQAMENKIPNWSKHCRVFDAKNPYRFVMSLIDDLCADDKVPLQMKKAFVYVRHHFTDTGRKILRNVVASTRAITEESVDVEKLLKVVVPYHTDDIDEMKFRLRRLLAENSRDDVKHIVEGINRFRYNTPKDLLLALLARLQMRLPENNQIQTVASAFLSNLLFPTVVHDISTPENGAIAFWLIVDSILEPNMNGTARRLISSLQKSLLEDLKMWDEVQSKLLPSRHECTYPRKCLLTILEKIRRVMRDNPRLLPMDISGTVDKLLTYVASNLVQKNAPDPCYDTPSILPVPDSKKTTGMNILKIKLPIKTTIKTPTERSRSTPIPSKKKTGSPKISTKSSKMKTTLSSPFEEYHKITSQPSKSTFKPPKTTSKPSGKTSKPSGKTSKPSGKTSKPSGKTSKPSDKTPTSSGKTSKTTETTSKPSKATSKLVRTTMKPTVTKSKRTQTKSKPSKTSEEKKKTSHSEVTSEPPKMEPELSKNPPMVSEPALTVPTKITALPAQITTMPAKVTTHPAKITTKPPVISIGETSESDIKTKSFQPTKKLLKFPQLLYGLPTTTIKKLTSGFLKGTSTRFPSKITKKQKTTLKPSKVSSISPSKAMQKSKLKEKPIASTELLLTVDPPELLSTFPEKPIGKLKSTSKSPKLSFRPLVNTAALSKLTLKPPGLSSALVSDTIELPKPTAKPLKLSPKPPLDITKSPKTVTEPPVPSSDLLPITSELIPSKVSKPPKSYFMLPELTTEIPKSKFKPTKASLEIIKAPKNDYQFEKDFIAPSKLTSVSTKSTTESPESTSELPRSTSLSPTTVSKLQKESSQPPGHKPKQIKKTKASHITTQTLKVTTKEPESALKIPKSEPTENISNSTSKLSAKTTRLVFPARPTSRSQTSLTIANATATTMIPPHQSSPKILGETNLSISKRSLLPPGMNVHECIVYDPKSNKIDTAPTIYTKADVSGVAKNILIFPSMLELHADLQDDDEIFENVNESCVHRLMTDIIPKLNNTMQGSYKTELLGKDWKQFYPTRISAIMGILKHAVRDPKVIAQPALRKHIRKYRDGLQFIGPYIYLPILSRWKKFSGEIIWSSIDTKNHDFSVIANSPPKEIETDIVTLPLINPAYWVLPVGHHDSDPLRSLLPRLPANGLYATQLKPLVDIFTSEGMKVLIERPIDVSAFPHRGSLLIHTLIGLKYNKMIQKDAQLFKLLKTYLKVLQQPAMYIKIPKDVIMAEQEDISGGWAVDTADLVELLPTPKSPADTKLYESMKNFLAKPNLLIELKIPTPPMETTKGSFMKKIINKALLLVRVVKDEIIRRALKYYQDKIDNKNRGKMNLGWIWSQKFIVSTELHLGELIEKLLPYDELSEIDKKAYDDLVVYFANHPHILNTHSIPLNEYKTRGKFLQGFFEHLIEDPLLDVTVKEKVKKLLPRVKMTGEGGKSLPPLARKALPLTTPAW